MRLLYIALATLLAGLSVMAQSASSIIPLPNIITLKDGHSFKNIRPVIQKKAKSDSLDYFVNYLHSSLSTHLGEVGENDGGAVNVRWNVVSVPGGDEAYRLTVTPEEIRLEGATKRALLYAAYTLDQWLMSYSAKWQHGLGIPCVTIEDAPLYHYRALMLDPARHFLPKEEVLYFLDVMAYYKYNTLQLHLTDDQGWRMEIKSHPELTAYTNEHANKSNRNNLQRNYYTQEELKMIIDYADQRGIRIVPEVNVPGHTAALLQALPQLKCDIHCDSTFVIGDVENVMVSAVEPMTYEVLDDVFRELSNLFPGGYIHLGGDESALDRNWEVSPEHIAFMQQQGIKSSAELMQFFFEKVLQLVRHQHLRPILWCELDAIRPPANDYLFPYPQDVTLISWRMGLTPKCKELSNRTGHDLILAPGEHAYLDYPQYNNDLPENLNWGMPITTLAQTYAMETPAPSTNSAIGVLGTLWAEAIVDINRACYMAWPRGMALAEVGWTNPDKRNFDHFRSRLGVHLNRLMLNGVPFRVPFEIYRNND